ncbi:bifunctional hydroxymethylpyrimidine kinase/phosphomethylpyrimidine kinase [Pseudodesulfovibrio senegalensis]|uniref:hydroxymethylpyrimidine kinase n=1 Tax=Pseudodesulfovibrio senegalensis TaxID=1721087 RepID=A0A6N6N166_9BACT|nr:bifunctional hydroxymethylpyrimidine kinase/phosphomethylpyrimidine kinase [Pseudodesulfovibrio senegalensis]KAB1441234.1 bifunctional hydroxymethylpyrimidine kinase/phosphomethylpyrimidine kinase [Pseudodesulfovibrio senegalensis]
MKRLPGILTIAGSDSGGGAGIQADLKTITMLGAYGASVVTALTAQNTCAVTGIHAPSPEFVARQMETVLKDISVDAAKTGMLFSAEIIEAVSGFLPGKAFPLVVDPVCVAQSGGKLLKPEAVEAMVRHVFPHADLLTPNIPEAELFASMQIENQEDIARAAEKLLAMGPGAVLIKGGHMESVTATDWFVEKGHKPIPLIQPRVETKNNHGTGCTLSAAIATGLGQGLEMAKAIRNAQRYLNLALRAGFDVGQGSGPPNHLAPMFKERAKKDTLERLDRAGRRLMSMSGFSSLVPEVRMNLALAVPFADDENDVAAFTGGIVSTRRGDVTIAGYPCFGASVHVAKGLVAARRVAPAVSAMINLRQDKDVVEALERAGVPVAWVDGEKCPPYVAVADGAWEEWAVYDAMQSYEAPEAVRAVCDRGGPGREPLVRLLAEDCADLMARLCALIDCSGSRNGC